jgi:hypothetical protein
VINELFSAVLAPAVLAVAEQPVMSSATARGARAGR